MATTPTRTHTTTAERALATTTQPQRQPIKPATTMTRHTPRWRPRRHARPGQRPGDRPRRHIHPGQRPAARPNQTRHNHAGSRSAAARRFLAGAAALVLSATGAIAVAPGTAAADTHRDNQWYLDDFSIDKVHKLSQGEGVKIGVIDSGIDPNHPDLKGNIEAGIEFDGNGKTDGNAHTDSLGHGTAVTDFKAPS